MQVTIIVLLFLAMVPIKVVWLVGEEIQEVLTDKVMMMPMVS